MRFAHLTMIAAAFVVAAPADAATFLAFSLSGHGYETAYDANVDPSLKSRETDFVINFALDIGNSDPSDPNWTGRYISDGSSFFAMNFGDNYTYTINNGLLKGDDQSDYGAYILTNNSHFTVNLDPSINNFAGITSGAATGQADIYYSGHYYYRQYTGAITHITVSRADTFSGITAYAVPEPATWLMMILGFGAVAGTMRRRRQPVTVSTAAAAPY